MQAYNMQSYTSSTTFLWQVMKSIEKMFSPAKTEANELCLF